MPIFPVSLRQFQAVKERVTLAREVDVMDLRATKESKEIGWLEKTAEEMDIMLDEFEAHNALDDDETGGRGSRKDDVAERMKLVKLRKKELAKLLQQPIFARGFSYRYPTATGELSVPMMGGIVSKDNAVSVMKEAMDKDKDSSVLKGDHLKNYKGKKAAAAANQRKAGMGKKEQDGGVKGVNGLKKSKEAAKGRKGAVANGKVEEEVEEVKLKSSKRYYMPQPKTSTKGKKGKGKKAKPTTVG